jgi:hypothetical protein
MNPDAWAPLSDSTFLTDIWCLAGLSDIAVHQIEGWFA